MQAFSVSIKSSFMTRSNNSPPDILEIMNKKKCNTLLARKSFS
jgi:hypothetical protein